MNRSSLMLALLTGLAFVSIACQTSPKTEGGKASLRQDARATVAVFKQNDPSLKETFFDTAYGWAVFPSVGKGAVGVGGAYGQGVVYEQGELVGYCDLSQGTVGLQLGGQAYREIIFFEYKESLDHFKTGNFAFAAQASAVAVTAGASTDVDYDRGVAVFTMTKGGLMFEASLGGQQFTYEPIE
ncbi:MAG: YSC84-related protein [Planctomycetota bacterium]|nr:YSC84-related protein [Planctomycetota bacterium]